MINEKKQEIVDALKQLAYATGGDIRLIYDALLKGNYAQPVDTSVSLFLSCQLIVASQHPKSEEKEILSRVNDFEQFILDYPEFNCED